MDKSLKAILLLIAHHAPELFEPKNFNQLVNAVREQGWWGREDSIRRGIPEIKDRATDTQSKIIEAQNSGMLTFPNLPKHG